MLRGSRAHNAQRGGTTLSKGVKDLISIDGRRNIYMAFYPLLLLHHAERMDCTGISCLDLSREKKKCFFFHTGERKIQRESESRADQSLGRERERKRGSSVR